MFPSETKHWISPWNSKVLGLWVYFSRPIFFLYKVAIKFLSPSIILPITIRHSLEMLQVGRNEHTLDLAHKPFVDAKSLCQALRVLFQAKTKLPGSRSYLKAQNLLIGSWNDASSIPSHISPSLLCPLRKSLTWVWMADRRQFSAISVHGLSDEAKD